MKPRWVTFLATGFEHKTPGPHFINPTCFGEDVAVWLRPALAAAGLEPSEPIQEDYGWGVWTSSGGDPYWVAISVFEDGDEADDDKANDDKADEAEWGIGISYDPGFNLRQRLFHRPREEDLRRVSTAVDAALRAHASIRQIEWWLDVPHRGSSTTGPA